jgi:hypothetical protein
MNREHCKGNKNILTALWLVPLLLLITSGGAAALECYDCHGTKSTGDIRPLDSSERDPSTGGFPGNHRTHLPQVVTPSQKGTCAICHPGSDTYTSSHYFTGKGLILSLIHISEPTRPY